MKRESYRCTIHPRWCTEVSNVVSQGTRIRRKSVIFNPPAIHPSWLRWWAVGEEAEAPSRELQSRSCDCSGGAIDFSHFCRRLYRVKLRYTRKICGTVSLLHTILYSLFVGGPLRRSFLSILQVLLLIFMPSKVRCSRSRSAHSQLQITNNLPQFGPSLFSIFFTFFYNR